ncbi:MAG: 23S rRNA (adenine(2030)-N(6))-methyltransferase RlmJ [Pseudomonadota bacterium]
MLSYQHGFHAGNRADVLKHAVLDVLLQDLASDRKPVLHVETHSGRGIYDLTGQQSRKTGEADDGILELFRTQAPPESLASWLDLMRQRGKKAYPGSPYLAALRLGDLGRFVLFEKHPTEHDALVAAFQGDPRAQIKKADGNSGALKLQPRRGERMLVFSDPSYETLADMEALADWTPRALARWPDAIVAVWLPLFKDEREAEFGAFLASLESGIVAGARWPAPDDKDTALSGSALVAFRVPPRVRRAAAQIADDLTAHWMGTA